MADQLLTVKEAAKMLAVKTQTVYQWSYERRIPSVKLRGRALGFKLSDIEKIIKEDTRPALRSMRRDQLKAG